ncbi:MAG: hypothetical protein ACJ8FU_03705, partial [Xanthobacteraceae bacterium]
AMLRRIARTGVDRLATFLDGGGAGRPPTALPAGEDAAVVAAAGDGRTAAGFMPARQAQRSAQAPRSRRHWRSPIRGTSAPLPKFASVRRALECELRNRKEHWEYRDFLVRH